MRMALAMLGCFGLIGLVGLTVPLPGQEKGKTDKDSKTLADEFTYPGAEKLTTAARPTAEGPGIFSAKYTSADGWGKVAAFYRKKLGLKGEEIIINPGFEPGIRGSVLDDSSQPKGPGQVIGEPRPVSLVVFLKKTPAAIVNVVISRAKDEKVTHIVLTVVDNKSE
jgi:hypothetical protein